MTLWNSEDASWQSSEHGKNSCGTRTRPVARRLSVMPASNWRLWVPPGRPCLSWGFLGIDTNAGPGSYQSLNNMISNVYTEFSAKTFRIFNDNPCICAVQCIICVPHGQGIIHIQSVLYRTVQFSILYCTAALNSH